MRRNFLSLVFCALILPCMATAEEFTTDFNVGPEGWLAGFADYPVGSEKFYELESGMQPYETAAGESGKAFMLSGVNHSDDLCMYLSQRIAGLKPNTRYDVQFSVTFASSAPAGSAGVGGAPGEGVVIKAGVTRQRPMNFGRYARMNIGKGNQTASGRDAKTIGNVAVDVPADSPSFKLKTLTSSNIPFSFKTDGVGGGWLFVCSDSGFEAKTVLYFTRISAILTSR